MYALTTLTVAAHLATAAAVSGHGHGAVRLLAASGNGGGASGDGLATAIRNFIAPIVLLVIGIMALKYLFRHELTQFFEFAALTVGIGVFFYSPDVVQSLSQVIANAI